MAVVVYLHPVEGDGWPPPYRISYYLLEQARLLACNVILQAITCSGGVRGSKVGLDLDLVATKHWLAPTGLLRVPSLLKPSVR
jgi:hypothetical protein